MHLLRGLLSFCTLSTISYSEQDTIHQILVTVNNSWYLLSYPICTYLHTVQPEEKWWRIALSIRPTCASTFKPFYQRMQNDSVSKMSSVLNTKQWTKSRNQVFPRPLRRLLSDRFNNFITNKLETRSCLNIITLTNFSLQMWIKRLESVCKYCNLYRQYFTQKVSADYRYVLYW